MSLRKARVLINEVLDECAIDARARSLLQAALVETWHPPPPREKERESEKVTHRVA